MNDMRDRNIEQIVSYFQEGCKDTFMMGLELEHFVVDSQNALLPYSGDRGVEALLYRLRENYREEYRTEGHLIGLAREDCVISIEPAGQLEVSIAPQTQVEKILEIYSAFRREVDEILTGWGCHIIEKGYLPAGRAASMELIPKKRYQYMDAYFQKIGDRGCQMMRGTAATQVSIDYANEEDFVQKYETAYKLTPILSWITDNVSVFEDEPNHRALMRTRIWQGVDSRRTNVYRYLQERALSFEGYGEFAYDTPLIVVKKDGVDVPTEKTAAQLYKDRLMSREEIEHMLSMVFPSVRLKKVLELRGADSMPIMEAAGYALLVKNLLKEPYATECLLQSMGLKSIQDADCLTKLLLEQGNQPLFMGQSMKQLAGRLFALADADCRREEQQYLQLLQKRLER